MVKPCVEHVRLRLRRKERGRRGRPEQQGAGDHGPQDEEGQLLCLPGLLEPGAHDSSLRQALCPEGRGDHPDQGVFQSAFRNPVRERKGGRGAKRQQGLHL